MTEEPQEVSFKDPQERMSLNGLPGMVVRITFCLTIMNGVRALDLTTPIVVQT